MKYYIISLVITFIFMFLSEKSQNNKMKYFFAFLSILPFFLLTGLRDYSVGVDTKFNYAKNYLIAVNYGSRLNFFKFYSTVYSPGFTFIIFILSKFFKSPTYLFLFCSFITTSLTFKSIYENSKNKFVSLFIYFFSGAMILSMNGMRGYISFSIILNSYRYIKNRNPIKFIISIIIASLIHPISLIAIILYPMYNFKIKKIHLLVLLFLSPVFALFGSRIIAFFLKNTSFYNYFVSNKSIIDPLYMMLFYNLFLFILFYINYEKNKNDLEYNYFLKLQVLSVFVCLLSFTLPQSFRVEQMIDYWQILSVPYIWHILKVNKKDYRILAYMFIIFFLIFYFSRTIIVNDSNWVKNYIPVKLETLK